MVNSGRILVIFIVTKKVYHMLLEYTVLFRVDLHFVFSLFRVLVGRVMVVYMDFTFSCVVGQCLQILHLVHSLSCILM